MTFSPLVTVIDEHRIDGHRLGRHVEHDPRSLPYAVDDADVKIETISWARHTPILDQGNLGSCCGNAATGALGCDPYFPTIPQGVALDENEAVKLYELATTLDSIGGAYPPDDTGSTGLAVAKAAQRSGLINGYTHALSLNAALAAIQSGPAIIGINWYEAFDQPNADGYVSISGQVRGGHEIVVRGVDVQTELVHCDNSWGSSWGAEGSFCFSFDDFGRLLDEGGDCTLFTPLSAPAPTPTPVPTPGKDAALKAAGKTFWKAWKTWEAS